MTLSPNFGERRDGARPDLVVIHYTGMASCAESQARLCDPVAEVSAHWLIDTDGTSADQWVLCDGSSERFKFNTSGTVTTPTSGNFLVRVAIKQDDLPEGQESFTLSVTGGTQTQTGTGTIRDDGQGAIFKPDGTLDLNAIKGSGPHGRIVEKDVEAAKAGGGAKAAPAAAAAAGRRPPGLAAAEGAARGQRAVQRQGHLPPGRPRDRKSTRLNSSH